jgi:hypothetical protein
MLHGWLLPAALESSRWLSDEEREGSIEGPAVLSFKFVS